MQENGDRALRIEFVIPSIPVAQPRQRHALIGGHIRNYTPGKHPVNAFKAACQLAASQVYQGPVLDCPLRMDFVFVFPRPASVPKRLGTGRLAHTGKPDRDNVMKSLQDALEGILFRNDSLICDGRVQKCKAAVGEQAHVEVVVTDLEWQ